MSLDGSEPRPRALRRSAYGGTPHHGQPTYRHLRNYVNALMRNRDVSDDAQTSGTIPLGMSGWGLAKPRAVRGYLSRQAVEIVPAWGDAKRVLWAIDGRWRG